MKKIKNCGLLLAMAAVLTMTTMTACSSENDLVETPNVEQPTAEGVKITVSASFADDATTRSEVVVSTDANGKKRTLKFTEGDRLYVYGNPTNSNYDLVAGMLTMVENSLTPDGKSAEFTGSLQAHNGNSWVNNPHFGDADPLVGTTATLIHKDMVEGTDYNITSGKNPNQLSLKRNSAPDVETLMTKSLKVAGGYNSSTKSFALSSNDVIFNCVFTGLAASTKYYCQLRYPDGTGHMVYGGHYFTTDANGMSSHAFCFPDPGGEHPWEMVIDKNTTTIGTISLGTLTLQKKIYNVNRCWAGNRFIKLNGKFTINAGGKQVYFAPGNLQAVCTSADSDPNTQETWTWGIAANQWDYVENAVANSSINGKGSVSAAGTVDLFGWSTASTYYGIHNSNDASTYSGDFVDWGNTIGTGWRTLTIDEWIYLFDTRAASTVNSTANARYVKAKVNSKCGVILFPDSYTHPAGVTVPANINTPDASLYSATEYDATAWAKMEAAGCVFLPAAGLRAGTAVNSPGSAGYYQSSTPDATDVNKNKRVFFNSSKLNDNYDGHRERGYSVRLVRDVN